MKAPGIGNSCDEFMGPTTYQHPDHIDNIKQKILRDKYEKLAVTDWHKRLFDKDKEKSPQSFP